MRFGNKIIAFILLFSLIFTSKAFVVFAENKNIVASEEIMSEIETSEESTTIAETSEEVTTVESTETSEVSSTIEESEETTIIEATSDIESVEKSKSLDDTSDVKENEVTNSLEPTAEETEDTETNEETEAEEDAEIIETSETTETNENTETSEAIDTSETAEETTSQSKNGEALFGAPTLKFRVIYFLEDMSDIDSYVFDFDPNPYTPDSVVIANNELKAIEYYDKRYTGVVDIGLTGDNYQWFREHYLWNDPNIYSDSSVDIATAYDNWRASTPSEDKV